MSKRWKKALKSATGNRADKQRLKEIERQLKLIDKMSESAIGSEAHQLEADGIKLQKEKDKIEARQGKSKTDFDPSKLEYNGMRADSLAVDDFAKGVEKSKYSVGDRVYNGSSWGDVMSVEPGGFGGGTYRVKLDNGEVVTAREGGLRRSVDDADAVDKIPLDIGAKVDTPRGSGKIVAYNRDTGSYQVDVEGDKVWFGKEQLTRKAINDPDADEPEEKSFKPKIGDDVYVMYGPHKNQQGEVISVSDWGDNARIRFPDGSSEEVLFQNLREWKSLDTEEKDFLGYLDSTFKPGQRVRVPKEGKEVIGTIREYIGNGDYGIKLDDGSSGVWREGLIKRSLPKSLPAGLPVTNGYRKCVVVKSLNGQATVRDPSGEVREESTDTLQIDRERFCVEDWMSTATMTKRSPTGIQKRIKQGPALPETAKDDDRTLTYVMTTGTQDRDGETVDPEGGDFGEYDVNPTVQWNHDTDDFPIGKLLRKWNEEIGEGTRFPQVGGPKRMALLGDVQFSAENPKGDLAYRMAKEGTLGGASISFLPEGPTRKNDGGGNHYPKWKLLEFTICSVGSNPDAVRLSKSLKTKAVKFRVKETGDGTGYDIVDETGKPVTSKPYGGETDAKEMCREMNARYTEGLDPFKGRKAAPLENRGRKFQVAQDESDGKWYIYDGTRTPMIELDGPFDTEAQARQGLVEMATRNPKSSKGIFDGETLSVVRGPYAGMLATVKQDQGAKLLCDIYDPDNSQRPPVLGVTMDRTNLTGSQWKSIDKAKPNELKPGDKVKAMRHATGYFEPATVVSCSARSAMVQFDKDGVTVDTELEYIVKKGLRKMNRKRWINRSKKSLWILKSEGDPAVDPAAEQEIKDYIEERGLDDVKVEEEAPAPEDGYVEQKDAADMTIVPDGDKFFVEDPDAAEKHGPFESRDEAQGFITGHKTAKAKGDGNEMTPGVEEKESPEMENKAALSLEQMQAMFKIAPDGDKFKIVRVSSGRTLEDGYSSEADAKRDLDFMLKGDLGHKLQGQTQTGGGSQWTTPGKKTDDLADDVAKRAKELATEGADDPDALNAAMAEVDVPVEMAKAVRAIACKRISKAAKFNVGDKVRFEGSTGTVTKPNYDYYGQELVEVKFDDGHVGHPRADRLSISKETDLTSPDKISETEINAAMKNGPDGSDFDPTEMRLKDAMSDCVSHKIEILRGEGKAEDQAAAIAYSMCGEKVLKHGVKKHLILKVARAAISKASGIETQTEAGKFLYWTGSKWSTKLSDARRYSDTDAEKEANRIVPPFNMGARTQPYAVELSIGKHVIKITKGDQLPRPYGCDKCSFVTSSDSAGAQHEKEHPGHNVIVPKSLKSIKTAKTDDEAQAMAQEKAGVMRGTTVRLLNGLQGTVAGIGYAGITVRDARGQVHTGLDFDDFTTAGIGASRGGGFDLGRYMSMSAKMLKSPALKKKELDSVSDAADKLAKAMEDEEKKLKELSGEENPSEAACLQQMSKDLSEDAMPTAIEDIQKRFKRLKKMKRVSKRVKAVVKSVKAHRKALSEKVTNESTWSGITGASQTWDGTTHTGAADTWANNADNPDTKITLGKAIKMAKAAGKTISRKKLKRKEVEAIMEAADLLDQAAEPKKKDEPLQTEMVEQEGRSLSEKLRKIAYKRGKKKAEDIDEMKRLKDLSEDAQPSAIEDLQKRKAAEEEQKTAEGEEEKALLQKCVDGLRGVREKVSKNSDILFQMTGQGRN